MSLKKDTMDPHGKLTHGVKEYKSKFMGGKGANTTLRSSSDKSKVSDMQREALRGVCARFGVFIGTEEGIVPGESGEQRWR